MKKQSSTPSQRQQGVVLLVLMMVLFMAGAGAFISVMNNNAVDRYRDDDTTRALRDAREIILAYSMAHAEYADNAGGVGKLLCPDTDGDGQEDDPCPDDAIGRLPSSITLPSGDVLPVSDFGLGIDQQLWYAITDDFAAHSSGAMNTGTVGTLSVDGRSGIAAVLIAPGGPLIGQTRPNNTASNYLEAGNVTGPNFVNSDPTDPDGFNDRVLAITGDELVGTLITQVMLITKQQLAAYADDSKSGKYPKSQKTFDEIMSCREGEKYSKKHECYYKYSSKTDTWKGIPPLPDWFLDNEWNLIMTYDKLKSQKAEVELDDCASVFLIQYDVATIRDPATC